MAAENLLLAAFGVWFACQIAGVIWLSRGGEWKHLRVKYSGKDLFWFCISGTLRDQDLASQKLHTFKKRLWIYLAVICLVPLTLIWIAMWYIYIVR